MIVDSTLHTETLERQMPITVVTGQSGTGVRESLARYCEERDLMMKSLEHDFIVPWMRSNASRFPRIRPGQRVAIQEVLKQPETLLRPIWKHGFEEALNYLETLDTDAHLVLTLHASWWHLTSEAFVSPVDFGDIAALTGRVGRVICLIDDVFDVYDRLSQPGHLFEPAPSTRHELVGRLLRLLRWREMEVRYSSHFAQAVRADPILVGIKHPKATFNEVVDGAPVAYLSHPITAAREAGDSGLDGGWGSQFMNYVDSVAKGIVDSEQVALIQPTSIDEYRFAVDPDNRPQARLTRRWDLAPQLRKDRSPLGWDYASGDRDGLADPFTSFEPAFGNDIQGLREEIQRQIKWRDRELVEQASHLVLVRPYAGDPARIRDTRRRKRRLGRCSGGVYVEIDLQNQLRLVNLMAVSDKERKSDRIGSNALVHTPTEEKARKATAVVSTCDHLAATGYLINWSASVSEELWVNLWKDDGDFLQVAATMEAGKLGQLIEEQWFELFDPSPRFSLPEFESTMSSTDAQFAERSTAQNTAGNLLLRSLARNGLTDSVRGWQGFSLGLFAEEHTVLLVDETGEGERVGRTVADELLRG